MQTNPLRTKLHQNQPLFGVLSSTIDPLLAEIIGHLGFDFFMLDAEHGPLTPAHAANLVRGCETAAIVPLARVGSKDPKALLPYLDAGVMGIMLPGTDTVTDVERLVTAVKYPPLGQRGMGPGRAARYMLLTAAEQAAYITRANQEILVLPQFENAAALPALPQMVQVSGVDGFVIGPRDLSLSLGHADNPTHPQVQAVIDEAIAIIRQAGLWVGITAGSATAVEAQLARGAHIILTTLPALLQLGADAFRGKQK